MERADEAADLTDWHRGRCPNSRTARATATTLVRSPTRSATTAKTNGYIHAVSLTAW